MLDNANRSHLALAIVLTAVAGWVDAIGLLRLGHFFVSFMSGDSTRLVVFGLDGNWREAASAGSIVALFVAGVFVGRLLSNLAAARGRPVVLSVEALLLLLAAIGGSSRVAVIVPIVVAMGLQNAAMDKERAAGMGLSYVTGTLVSLGDGLADALRSPVSGRSPDWRPHLLHWLGLLSGAACGTAAYGAWSTRALLFPAAIAAILAAVSGMRARRRQG